MKARKVDDAALLRMAGDGRTAAECARRLGCKRSTVYVHMWRLRKDGHGITLPRSPCPPAPYKRAVETPDEVRRFRALTRAGHDALSIADLVGCSEKTARATARRLGCGPLARRVQRDAGIRAHVIALVADGVDTVKGLSEARGRSASSLTKQVADLVAGGVLVRVGPRHGPGARVALARPMPRKGED